MNNRKSIVVYTALFGKYDNLIDPREDYEGCDFVCFTDQENLQTEIWRLVKIDKKRFESPIVANRHFKWLPHRYFPNQEISLYLDSNIILYTTPHELIKKYLQHYDMAMPKHFARDCLYEEAITCINENKLSIGQIYSQLKYFKNNGLPDATGLYEQNIILRRHHSDFIVNAMEATWNELKEWGNYRDQIVFPYILWKMKQHICLMDESARRGKSFLYMPHQKKSLNLMEKIFIGLRLRKRRCVDANLIRIMLKYIDITNGY